MNCQPTNDQQFGWSDDNLSLEFKEVYARQYCDLAECGVTKPPTAVTLEEVVQSITLHHTILKSKAEIDQFAAGLSCLGTRSNIMKYPHLLKQFFTVTGRQVLTAGTVRYSEAGSNERKKEERTYMST